jgi:hypothetical protein
MTLKICYNNQIHRISKLPSDFASLAKTVSLLFENQLPPNWTLQYVDSDGDRVMLSDEHDFSNLVEDGLLTSTKSVKVFVLPLDDMQNPAIPQIHEPSKVDSVSSQPSHGEEFQFLEKPEDQNVIQSISQVESTNYQEIDHKEEEKPLLADQSAHLDEPPKEENAHKQKHKQHKAKKIIKKLARESISPERRTALEEKLRKLQDKLNPEERERLAIKKDKIAKRKAEKQAKRKSALKEAVTDIIYEHLPTIASLAKDLLQEEKPSRPQEEPSVQKESKVVHARIECDGCGEGPIVGIRYKCSVCPDFDYCERCEARIEHPHPFIKLRTPNQDSFMQEPHPFMRSRGGCPRPRSPRHCPRREEMKDFKEKLREFKQSDSFKNIVASLFTGARPNKEEEEKTHKDVQQLYSTLPSNTQENITSHYNNLPEELRNNINKFLGGLPEQIINKQSQTQENKEEVKIEDETLIKATEPEISVKINEPLIQEVEVIEEKKPEVVQKEYSQEIRTKAQSLKDIFEEADINNLLEFVSQTPDMSLEELVENYLTL